MLSWLRWWLFNRLAPFRAIARRLTVSLVIFLIFWEPILTLSRLGEDYLTGVIVRSLFGTPDLAQDKYDRIVSAIYYTVSPLLTIIIIAALLALGWLVYYSGARLLYALGFRSRLSETALVPAGGPEMLGIQVTDSDSKESTLKKISAPLYLTDKPLLGIENARQRLADHVTSLRNASILNLFVGIGIAVSGIYVLYTVFIDIERFGVLAEKKVSAVDFLIFSLLPRLSATLFIQIFAYFFLLMYRSNLADVRYFQNEMSNLDVYGTAVSLALKPTVSATEKSVISALLKVERNRVMNRNQRSINPADDTEMHGKLLTNLNQTVGKMTGLLSKLTKGAE